MSPKAKTRVLKNATVDALKTVLALNTFTVQGALATGETLIRLTIAILNSCMYILAFEEAGGKITLLPCGVATPLF